MAKKSVRDCLIFSIVFCMALVAVHPISAQKKKLEHPDFTRGDQLPKNAEHDWNLGPTGARGWIYSNRLETTEARQIYITKVDVGSPAENTLRVGDVILGVSGQAFSYDPRTEFGKAISAAEASGGKLRLIRWRNGKRKSIRIKLPILGAYASTAPFDCPKSERIFQRGCERLAATMRDNSGQKANPIVRSLNTLALLASGEKKYLPLIREQVEWASKYSDLEGRSLHSWHYGPVNILLAEYTLATGDQKYLPDLKRITMEIVGGQSKVGSWGHRFALPTGQLRGYGMMNAPGIPLTTSLILARQAGVDDPALDLAIERSTRLLRFYVGKGSVPYGDHHPWIETHDDNGKNGIAALMFNLLEDREAATYFSHMSVASHGAEKEMGHTGNFFNLLWAMPSVALSGPNASGAWMQEFGWYFDLARRWDGSFQHQGPAQPKHDSYRRWDSTGAYLLAYAQSERRLYLTGKKQGVVKHVDQATAADLVSDGQNYSHRLKVAAYENRTETDLVRGLQSWSPVVRERSAVALAGREGNHLPAIIDLLESNDLDSQLGACQAIGHLGQTASETAPMLARKLDSESLWLRIKAAEALGKTGKAGRAFAPQLLEMLASDPVSSDPRGMQQRYLTFALFDRGDGLLRGSLDGIDRESLFAAVRAGLQNEDGRARGVLAKVFNNLSYAEVESLLPEIYRAVIKPAPSGVMFADGVRLSGLDVLAKHRIQEGLPLCLELVELDRWGQGKRLPKCLKTLQRYGAAAKEMLPQLIEMQSQFEGRRQNDSTRKNINLIKQAVKSIETATDEIELRPLPTTR